MANNFRWFDQPAQYTPGGMEDYVAGKNSTMGYQPSQQGFLSLLGAGISGGIAPFVGDNQWLERRTKQQMEQQQADMEFKAALQKQAMDRMEKNQAMQQLAKFSSSLNTINEKDPFIMQPGISADGQTYYRPYQNPYFKQQMAVETKVKTDSAESLMKGINNFDTLAGLMKSSEALPKIGEGASALFKGQMSEKIGSDLGFDPVTKAYMKNVEGNAANLSKFFGDTGNIAIPERTIARELVPLVTDSDQTKALKKANLINIALQGMQSKSRIAGLDNDPNISEKLNSLSSMFDQYRQEAITLGVDPKRLNSFLQSNQSRYIKEQESNKSKLRDSGNESGFLKTKSGLKYRVE